MTIKHRAVKTSHDTGLASEWNDDHIIQGNVNFRFYCADNMRIENRTDWPAGPAAGRIVYRTDLNNFYGWNGTIWQSLTPAATVVVAADGSGHYTDIQDGIDALPAGGGVVFIKEGTYTITASIDIDKNNTTLRGTGRGTIILTGLNIPMIINSGGVNYSLIESLLITGAGAGNALNHGIKLVGDNRAFINQCWIEDCGGDGINIDANWDTNISGNSFKDCQGNGINAVDLIGGVIANNTFDTMVTDGIRLTDPSEVVIDGNLIFLAGGIGINLITAVWQPQRTTINGNIIETGDDDGIYIDQGIEILMTGNNVSNNDHHGISLFATISCLITGNYLYANDFLNTASFDGIFLSNSDNNVITGNKCEDNDRWEINISNVGCDKNLVMGNHCLGVDHVGAINDAGTNTHPNGASGTNNLQLDDLNIIA